MIVVYCSVAGKWVLAEPDGAEALVVLMREHAGEFSLIATDLLLGELWRWTCGLITAVRRPFRGHSSRHPAIRLLH